MGEQSDKTVDRVVNEDADAEDFEGHRLASESERLIERMDDGSPERVATDSEDDFEAHRMKTDALKDRPHVG